MSLSIAGPLAHNLNRAKTDLTAALEKAKVDLAAIDRGWQKPEVAAALN